MKLFECLACGQPLYFENTACESCGRRLGFLPESRVLSALESVQRRDNVETWRALAAPEQQYRFCCNAAQDACNWLVPAEADGAPVDQEPYCQACAHNRTVPDLSVPENITNWRRIESAKHRLFHGLLRLDLPHETREEDPDEGLAFDFLADPPDPSAPRIVTGHDNGLITINLVEADDAERERIRVQMHEPYRTLLGHFRHEVGHYYWERLVRRAGDNSESMATFRSLFGDERADYADALRKHYEAGPAAGWQESYVSAYAAVHPWEDFAETWAHYMHIVDALETAAAFGLRVKPRISRGEELGVRVDFDSYHAETIEQLIEAFLPVSFAVNSLNRSIGQQDFYPFVLSPTAIAKLGFIHQLCRLARAGLPQISGGAQPQCAPLLQANQPQIEPMAEEEMSEQTAALLTVASQLALDPVS